MSGTHHMSESNEHYGPPEYVESARALMGKIDLDPASSVLANTIIKAETFFDKKMNGFHRDWFGNVYHNPPGGICDNQARPVLNARKGKRKSCKVTGACGLPPGHEHPGQTSAAKAWWFKLAGEYMSGRVDQAVFMGFNLELQQTTQTKCFNSADLPSVLKFPVCYPATRIKFWHPTDEGELEKGTQPTHANIVVYLPKNWSEIERLRFETLFSDFGEVVWPLTMVRR